MTSDADLIRSARRWARDLDEPELAEVLLHLEQALTEYATENEQLRREVGLLREVQRRPLMFATGR